MLTYKAVKETVVLAEEDKEGNRYLCAYVVSDGKVTISSLREHLSENLPHYMIPSFFVQIDRMILTPNGKIDRKALPTLKGSINTDVEYIDPILM